MTTPRQDVASAAFDGSLYVAGGLGANGITRAVEFYDPGVNSWKSSAPLPLALHHAMGVAFQRAFVVLGGYTTSQFDKPSNRVFAFARGRWKELPPMKRARAAGGAVVAGRALYVIGGRRADGPIAVSEVFDGATWQDAPAIPTPREQLAVVTDGSAIYAAGGRRTSIDDNVATLERYDIATKAWTKLADAPTARSGAGMVFAGRQLLVFGGEGPTAAAGLNGVFRSVESYGVTSQAWGTLPQSMPAPRHGFGFGLVGSTFFIAGGAPHAGFAASSGTDGARLALNPVEA